MPVTEIAVPVVAPRPLRLPAALTSPPAIPASTDRGAAPPRATVGAAPNRRPTQAKRGDLPSSEKDIRTALAEAGVTRVEMRTVLSPAWTTDWIGPEAREKLRAYGIAPPGKADGGALVSLTRARPKVPCPWCGSTETELQSEFGSTACKAIHVCRACRQPFDEFKAI